MLEHAIRVVKDSEAEEFIAKTLMPKCKDKVGIRLGDIFGWDYNEYVFSHRDVKRLRKEFSELTGDNKSSNIGELVLDVVVTLGVAGIFALGYWSGKHDFPR